MYLIVALSASPSSKSVGAGVARLEMLVLLAEGPGMWQRQTLHCPAVVLCVFSQAPETMLDLTRETAVRGIAA
jgi:hypothetical protein